MSAPLRAKRQREGHARGRTTGRVIVTLMRSDEAPARLLELLHEAGIDPEHPSTDDPERVWETIRRFASEPADDISPLPDSDGILAQYGTYDWGDGEQFELDMTRQFGFDDEHGQYSHMTQLRCTLLYEPTDQLRALGAGDLWSFGLEHDDFFRQALALPGFSRLASEPQQPLRLVIEYSES